LKLKHQNKKKISISPERAQKIN